MDEDDIMLHDFDDHDVTYQDDYDDDIDEYEDDDMGTTSRDQHISMMQSLSRHAKGISFILLMEHSVQGHGRYDDWAYKDYSIHPRFSQPCQGGETRKYESHNPGDCTQPHNSKPSDLFHPFPDGRPAAISFPLKGHKKTDKNRSEFLWRMISVDSPWIEGFGDPSNVDFLINDDGLTYGYTIGVKHLDIDPTVMINMINTISSLTSENYFVLLKHGLSHWEAVAVLMLNMSQITHVYPTSTYYFPSLFSAKRFFGQKPNDLSGGFYSDRTDYNRTYIADVFLGEESEGCKYWDETIKAKIGVTGYSPSVTTAQLAKAAKEYFAEQLASEEIVIAPYVYRDAYGNEHPVPIILSQQPVVKEAA